MERVKQDDESALSFLIRWHWSSLVQYARGYLHSPDDAEDVVQEAFVRVWRNRESWVPQGTVRGYLFTIVRNLCLHETERRRVRRTWAERQTGPSGFLPTPCDALQASELARALNAAIAKLPERRREAFALVCLNGLSYEEAADVLGVARSTLANQLSGALKELRSVVREVSELSI